MKLPLRDFSIWRNAKWTALLLGAVVISLGAACGPARATGTSPLPTVRVVTVKASATPAASQPPAVTESVATKPAPTAAAATQTTVATAAATESRPTPDAQTATRATRLPILMYHYVEPWPAGAGTIRQGLTVRPEDFAAQMAYLHDHGYVTVSLYDLIDSLTSGKALPAKAVVLTFDDGYLDLMDQVAPVLKPYGYTGTVFVITQLMDEKFPQYITWADAEALYAQGWKIEPHTKTHEELAGRDRDFQLYQMLGSVQTVQAHIGRQPRFFAYPSGKFDALTVELARELNLWGAVTVNFARVHHWDQRFTLGRVRVSGTGDLTDFVNGLEGDLQP